LNDEDIIIEEANVMMKTNGNDIIIGNDNDNEWAIESYVKTQLCIIIVIVIIIIIDDMTNEKIIVNVW